MKNAFKKFNRDENGVFTLEASILFPIILIITMTFIFFSLVLFQKATLNHSANMVAERLAYVWDNSDKDLSGEFDEYTTDNDDGLYWRVSDNQYLSKFGLDFFTSTDDTKVELGSSGGGDLPSEKLSRASSDMLPPGATGNARYENGISGSEIVVEMKSPLDLPGFVQGLLGIDSISVEASHSVIDPPEFIRSTDLVVYAAETVGKYKDEIMSFMKYWKRD